jgi:hypothetical protein
MSESYSIDVGFELSNDDNGTMTDFIVAFLISFFLNWIGYIATFFMNNRIATQSGGLSGFGLSLVKVALIIQYIQEKERPLGLSLLIILSVIIVGMSFFMYGLYIYSISSIKLKN